MSKLAYHKPVIRIIESEEYNLLCASGSPASVGTIIRGKDIPGETSISGDAKQDSHHNLWSADDDQQYWPIDNDQ